MPDPTNPLHHAGPRPPHLRLDAPSTDQRKPYFVSDIRRFDAAERDASVARLARSLAGLSEAERARALDHFEQGVRERLQSATHAEQPAPTSAQTRLDAFEPDGRAEMIRRQAEAWKAPPTPGQHTQRQDAADESDPEAVRNAALERASNAWRR